VRRLRARLVLPSLVKIKHRKDLIVQLACPPIEGELYRLPVQKELSVFSVKSITWTPFDKKVDVELLMQWPLLARKCDAKNL
jgi:hypothetical protein